MVHLLPHTSLFSRSEVHNLWSWPSIARPQFLMPWELRVQKVCLGSYLYRKYKLINFSAKKKIKIYSPYCLFKDLTSFWCMDHNSNSYTVGPGLLCFNPQGTFYNPWGDKVSMLTHAYPHKSLMMINCPSPGWTAHFRCGLMFGLICWFASKEKEDG